MGGGGGVKGSCLSPFLKICLVGRGGELSLSLSLNLPCKACAGISV